MSRIKLIVSLLCMSVCECKESKYGHVQSLLFPEPYPVGLYMQWYLKVPLGYQIQLTFNHLDIEPSANCSKDSLTVLHDNGVLGKFCGQTSTDSHHPGKNPILSPSNHVQLVLETDESRPQLHLGFFVFYEAVAVDCGIPEYPDPDLLVLTEENPLTTYNQKISFKCASEFYQLVGHANFTCDASGNWVSESGENYQNAPQCVPDCGLNEEFFPRGRVFGGERARLNQIPWQLQTKRPRAGASLISDRWALTSAIVVDRYETKTMIFYGGMIDGQDRNAVIMETEKIIIHPDFERDVSGTYLPNYDNDIALVKMSARVPLSFKIRPVCLPEKSARPVMKGAMGTVSGFGMTENKTISKFLQYAHLKEYSAPCFKTNLKVTNNMFCAGGEEVDSCKGDIGGPIVLPMLGTGSPKNPYRVEGIVSWGPAECGNEEFKGYYTKVQNYLDWIRETMEKN